MPRRTRRRTASSTSWWARATRPISSCTPPAPRSRSKAALADLEKVMKGDDKDAIESKITALEQAAQSLYAAAAGAHGGDGGAQAGASARKEEDVVDAEFTEVKDKK